MTDELKRPFRTPAQGSLPPGHACWCEGGDETRDFDVPPHLSDEADRIVAKRMAEIEQSRSQGVHPGIQALLCAE